jgi:hypothetical protein
VRKDEKRYYEELLEYSREHYMLYPYHLSDLIIRGFRITPFNYYLEMMAGLMTLEKSYDTLPNFTAFDCVRLLGIGRNQYIDIMNKYRSTIKFRGIGFNRRKPIKSLLPTQPEDILIEPWWVVNVGCIMEDEVKMLTAEEKQLIDFVIDLNKPMECGQLNFECVHALYKKGLIYLDVPLTEADFVEVPPLEGFVMNRTTGDYFETLLYKLFVSIDDRISLGELASLLEIDIDSVLNAVSLYCRLSFAKKKLAVADETTATGRYDRSWTDYKRKTKKTGKVGESFTLLEWNSNGAQGGDEVSADEVSETKVFLEHEGGGEETQRSGGPRLSVGSLGLTVSTSENLAGSLASPVPVYHKKRIGFLFDSTLTAFLMMGNLSSGLKNHAVTM